MTSKKKQNIALSLEDIPDTPNTWRLTSAQGVLGTVSQEGDYYLARTGSTLVGGKYKNADDAVEALIAEYNLHHHNA
ncbi:DUF2969 family protein [Schleiferilactobacillus perolens]|jgi:hypothetical protein|uniref:DUF1508 domain-containing protein n=1 Tax=Schleiferilactobacillus perolens DSM 12744 TaxID=1423792 RepID=A0A0R1N272_9LACO|nr:DUF2969 family protein [Schleiferilactobacillus perolens]KRL14257.1 hypothetical protein FD09_GL001424 [Schleiferilactobacillus perolens DSM 12744]MCI1892912.1 DUF2969 domain-containing protein [Schleiferilactobacillus harbinensis]MCI1913148.1 DUF2969 domain-containing protein [Schleiferilactobacillus harbinensis]MCI2172003.1 DUF2969 domain-containing protein [Schleiferilactobacillus perolens]